MKIFKKEKEVSSLALEYLDTAAECVAAGEAAVLAYLEDDIEAASTAQKRCGDLETAADEARREIGDLLFSGAYLPLIRGDIFSIIESLDKVPNAAESCAAFFLGEKPSIPEGFKAAFVEVVRESFGVIEALRAATKAMFKPKGGIGKIREHAHEVSIAESRVDNLEWNLTVAIFNGSDFDLSEKRHLKAALGRIAHLSDVAENVADRLELTAMKSVL